MICETGSQCLAHVQKDLVNNTRILLLKGQRDDELPLNRISVRENLGLARRNVGIDISTPR